MPRWAHENDFDALINAAAARWGVPAWVVKATIAKESSFNPDTDTGSVGLMQLEISTAHDRGYTGTRAALFSPGANIEMGTAHLAWLARRFPSAPWDDIYAAYNSGGIRRNQAGELVNSKGVNIVEHHTAGWRRAADYFRPGWRSEKRGPFGRSPARPAGGSSPS